MAVNDTTGVISHKGYIMSHRGYIMNHRGYITSHRGSIRSHLGSIMNQGGPPSRLVKFKKKVFHFVYVLPTKVARDGPGLTRERRDDDYSP